MKFALYKKRKEKQSDKVGGTTTAHPTTPAPLIVWNILYELWVVLLV